MEHFVLALFIFAVKCWLVESTSLHIQGFIPGKNPILSSQYVAPAACMAVDDINNQAVLSKYHLTMNISDSKCDMAEGVWRLIEAVVTSKPTQEQTPVMFFGGGCSVSSVPLAALTGPFYNATQVSFGATSPALSDRERFPKFFRTIPSEIAGNSLRFEIMKIFNWTRVATIHQTEEIFSMTSDSFRATYNDRFGYVNNNTVTNKDETNFIARSFTDDPSIPLQQIFDADVRIIHAWMYQNKATVVLCEAIQKGLTTNNHLWIIPGWYTQGWWKTVEEDTNGKCTIKQIEDVLLYSLGIAYYSYPEDPTIHGISAHDNNSFVTNYCKYLASYMKMEKENLLESCRSCSCLKPAPDYDPYLCYLNKHPYITLAYDGVWAIALALRRAEENLTTNFPSLSLAKFSYNNTIITDAIFSAFQQNNFVGVSGKVTFDPNGSRVGNSVLYQYRHDNIHGLYLEEIAIHNCLTNTFTWKNTTPILWKGGQPPLDKRIPKYVFLSSTLVAVLSGVVSLVCILTLAILTFNIVTIRKPLIANSAPHINTIIILGCLLLLVTCYLLGIDSNNPPPDLQDMNKRYSTICTLVLWFLTIGFTLSFGAMFSKTWQVYHVYINPKIRDQPFRMRNFLLLLGCFVLIDLVYLSIWTAVWPFMLQKEIRYDIDAQLEFHFEYCRCDKFNYLIGALFAFKGMLVLFGLFLAYESRNANYMYINDSHYLSIATYIVVISVGIGAPLSLVLSQNLFVDPAYGLTVFTIIFSVTAGLLILYIPKFVHMAKGRETLISEKAFSETVAADKLQLGTIGPPLQPADELQKNGTVVHIQNENDKTGGVSPVCHMNHSKRSSKEEDGLSDSGCSITPIEGGGSTHVDHVTSYSSANHLESIDEGISQSSIEEKA